MENIGFNSGTFASYVPRVTREKNNMIVNFFLIGAAIVLVGIFMDNIAEQIKSDKDISSEKN